VRLILLHCYVVSTPTFFTFGSRELQALNEQQDVDFSLDIS